MVEWWAVMNAIFKALGTSIKETKAIANDVHILNEKRIATDAKIRTAQLRFSADGMRRIVEKIGSGTATDKDFNELQTLFDESLDDVEKTLRDLPIGEAIGNHIIEKRDITVAAEFEDFIGTMKKNIRERLWWLINSNYKNHDAMEVAQGLLSQIIIFNERLEMLHMKAFGPVRQKALKEEANGTKTPKTRKT